MSAVHHHPAGRSRRRAAFARRALTCAVASAGPIAVASCRHDRVLAPPDASYTLAVSGGNLQHAPALSILPQAFSVTVRDADGAPVKGAHVVFHVRAAGTGGSRMLDSVGVTTTDGVASATLQLGTALDTTFVDAYPSLARSRSVALLAIATTSPSIAAVSPTSFGAGDTVTLRGSGLSVFAAGGVQFGGVNVAPLAGASDSLLRAVSPACLDPGPVSINATSGLVRTNSVAATYLSRTWPLTLAPLTALTVRSANLPGCVTLAGNGATYLVIAQFADTGSATTLIPWRLGSAAAATTQVAARAAVAVADNPTRRAFDAFLRRRERELAPEARAEAAARTGVAYLQPAYTVPAVGSTRAFKVVATLDGSRFANVTARLKYAGDHILVYVDTTGAGFSDDQYSALGALFDRDLYPIDIAAFGSESDLDHNGRVIALFTPVVNAMVAAGDCAQQGYVTGFFYGNDLLTKNANSNKGEIFYSFVPDSAAKYSCAHTARLVLQTLPGTFVHEMQHMISFNQHVLARWGDAEETWLNEGLSHIAEELASEYYEQKYPPPTGRSTPIQLFPDSAGPFITPQLLNAYVYLNATLAHSVTSYHGGGSIEERGATWLFLRWLAAQKGEQVFGRLVQTSKTGIDNVQDKTGETFGALFGDFSAALVADSLPGLPRSSVPPRYRFGDRNLRKLMARIAVVSGFSSPFPLQLYSLPTAGALRAQMLTGTMLHSLVQTKPGSPGVALSFTRQDLTSFGGLEGAQVTIFRLPP